MSKTKANKLDAVAKLTEILVGAVRTAAAEGLSDEEITTTLQRIAEMVESEE